MATYTKETALYDTGAIANDIGEAGQTASKYISADSTGIMIYDGEAGVQTPSNPNSTTRNVFIDDDSVDVREGTTVFATFGEIARVGSEENASITITNNSITGVGANGKTFFNYADASGTSTTGILSEVYSNRTTEDVPYGSASGSTKTINNTPTGTPTVNFKIKSGVSTVVNINLPTTANTQVYTDFTYNTNTYRLYATYNGDKTISGIKLNNRLPNGNGTATASCFVFYNYSTTAPSYEIGGDVSATGSYAFAEGYGTTASGDYSRAEGYGTTASGNYSRAEGHSTLASGQYGSHAEGRWTTASGVGSHAEGYGTNGVTRTVASGTASHAEGSTTTASGSSSHAEGIGTTASASASHAEGRDTIASSDYSHAEGYLTTASGNYSHAQNRGTIAQRRSQTAIGTYNIADTSGSSTSDLGDYAFIIGNGLADDARSNALTVDWNGNIDAAGGIAIDGNITAGGTISAVNNAFTVNSSGNVNTSGNVTATGTINAANGAFTVDSSGNVSTSRGITVWNHASQIGDRVQKEGGTDWTTNVTSSADAWIQLGNISLTIGRWIIVARARFTPTSSGNHYSSINISTTNKLEAVRDRRYGTGTYYNQHSTSMILSLASDATVYVNGMASVAGTWTRTNNSAFTIDAIRIM